MGGGEAMLTYVENAVASLDKQDETTIEGLRAGAG